MEHLRSRLKNTLQLTGMTPFTFGFNCGLMNTNTIKGFLEGKVKPHKASIQKIEEELMRMGANQLMEEQSQNQRIDYDLPGGTKTMSADENAAELKRKITEGSVRDSTHKMWSYADQSSFSEKTSLEDDSQLPIVGDDFQTSELDGLFLTQKERAVLVTQIMNANHNLMTLDEKTALIGKLGLI